MKLVCLDIENFRGIKKISITFGPTTVLVGENNTGKSSILDALQICLSRSMIRRGGQFNEYDYHLDSEEGHPGTAGPISITLHFSEISEDEWPDPVLQSLDPAPQVDAVTGFNTVTFRVTSSYNKDSGDYITTWAFLDGAGNELVKAKNPRTLLALQQFSPLFYLAALRDAGQEFRPKSQFWGPFVKSLKLEDATKTELEKALCDLNQKVLDSHTAFEDVRARLKETTKLIPLGCDDPVHIQALPGKVFDMLSKTQVMLNCRSGAKLPLSRHGEGMQSLAVLFLFDAFLKSRLAEDYDSDAEPILALEEPEAHLHPSAIRSLGELIQEIDGQKIITTHSGDILASVPLSSIRRLARHDGEIKVFQIQPDTLSPEDMEKVTYQIRSQRGHLLFARCWLLVEGQTEYRLLPELARQLNIPLDIHGICCMEFSQFGKLDMIIQMADDLGITWHVMTDNDDAGATYAAKVRGKLKGRNEAQHLSVLPEKDIEHFLWSKKYDSVYKSYVSENQWATISIPETHPDYPTQVIRSSIKSTSKPFLATAIAIEVKKTGSPGIPAELSAVLNAAVQLAEKVA
ncbi:MAG TPA: DUF2813 domain-containing protein [Deltaproteobacteria bacterium]|nr:DUF2813 domain-containing protein [Deltaproteobacteria bacterium]